MAFTIETGLERSETPTSTHSIGHSDSTSSTDKVDHIATGCFTALRAKFSLAYAKFKLTRFSFLDRIKLSNAFSGVSKDKEPAPPRKHLNAFLYHEITRLVCPELTNISSDAPQIVNPDNLPRVLQDLADTDLNSILLDHVDPLKSFTHMNRSPKILEKELANKFSHFYVQVEGEKDTRGDFYESYTASFFHPLNGQILWTQKWIPYKSLTVELSPVLFRKT